MSCMYTHMRAYFLLMPPSLINTHVFTFHPSSHLPSLPLSPPSLSSLSLLPPSLPSLSSLSLLPPSISVKCVVRRSSDQQPSHNDSD